MSSVGGSDLDLPFKFDVRAKFNHAMIKRKGNILIIPTLDYFLGC